MMATPEDIQTSLAHAAQLLEENRAEEAQEQLLALLERAPDNRQVKRHLGFSYLQQISSHYQQWFDSYYDQRACTLP